MRGIKPEPELPDERWLDVGWLAGSCLDAALSSTCTVASSSGTQRNHFTGMLSTIGGRSMNTSGGSTTWSLACRSFVGRAEAEGLPEV